MQSIKIKGSQHLARFGHHLAARWEGLSLTNKKRTLIGFCLSGACLFSGIALHHLVQPRFPRPAGMTPVTLLPSLEQPRISEGEKKSVRQYQRFLDSLSPQVRDSFLRSHPHLADSLRLLQEYIEQQN